MNLSCYSLPNSPQCFSMFGQISRSMLLKLTQNVLAEAENLEGAEQLKLMETRIQADKPARRYWTDYLGALAHSRKFNSPVQVQVFQALAAGLDLGYFESIQIPDALIDSIYFASSVEKIRKGSFYELSLNPEAEISIVDDVAGDVSHTPHTNQPQSRCQASLDSPS